MKVVVDDSPIFFRWVYENPELSGLLVVAGISEDDARKIVKEERGGWEALRRKLLDKGVLLDNDGARALPRPNIIHCIAENEEGKELAHVMVKKPKTVDWKKWTKERARCLSLGKLAKKMYPGSKRDNPHNRGIRKQIGVTYHTRRELKIIPGVSKQLQPTAE